MKKKNTPNKFDSNLPKIDVKLNSKVNKINRLPKIISEGEKKFNESNRVRLVPMLNPINPNDLIGLSSIRIVSEIKPMYGGKAIGCYCAKSKNRDAQIWLNEELFGWIRKILSFFEHAIYKDRLLEVLYHEIGHHKATRIHSISKYKGEAFAEKYMAAYKKAYFKKYTPFKIAFLIFKFFRLPIILVVKGISYSLRNKFPMANLVYRYTNKELTREEYSAKAQKLSNSKENNSKNKRLHPLKESNYRKKFKINDIY